MFAVFLDILAATDCFIENVFFYLSASTLKWAEVCG